MGRGLLEGGVRGVACWRGGEGRGLEGLEAWPAGGEWLGCGLLEGRVRGVVKASAAEVSVCLLCRKPTV